MEFQRLCIFALPAVLGCAGTVAKNTDGTTTWSSKSHPVSIKLIAPWKLIYPQQDRADRMTVAVQTKPNGQGCVFSIRIGEDGPKNIVNDEQWYQALQTSILQANERNQLVDEYDVKWQGRTYHRTRFQIVNSNTGEHMCHWIDTCRTGTHIITIISAFPFDQALQNDGNFPSEIDEIRSNCNVFPIIAENTRIVE